MKLRMKTLLLMLVVVLMLLVGCGVSQEQYNAVVAEREAAKAELQVVQNELQKVKTEQEQTITKARAFAEVISSLFVPILKGEITTEAELAMLGISWLGSINNLGDEKAQRLFDDWVNSNFADQEMLDFFIYIFETLQETLE